MKGPKSFFRRFLVPLDGSASSCKAAEYALRLAGHERCQVIALNVVDEGLAEEMARYVDRPLVSVLERMTQSGKGYVEDLRRAAAGSGVELLCEVRVGVPHVSILETASELGADLIVMGKVGRKGPRRVLIGSVTERVIEQASIPVLVVK